jgi:hypothetical protein
MAVIRDAQWRLSETRNGGYQRRAMAVIRDAQWRLSETRNGASLQAFQKRLAEQPHAAAGM